jgi:hypothetical protein
MTILDKVKTQAQKNNPEGFAAMDSIRECLATMNTNRSATGQFIEGLKKKHQAAILAWRADNSLGNFLKLRDAATELKSTDDAYMHAPHMGIEDEQTKSLESIDTLQVCLKSIRDVLAASIKRLNDQEAKNLAAEGVDFAGENPAITQLRVLLTRYAEAISSIDNFKENADAAGSPWNSFQQLV